ncbi:tetratricopeptide repeat protein [Micromonospora fluostatini]|uniref:Tetratricopeptide repeat protein n=1 Tax=Micromonospora fluostatini TaxID=1629071 RepID=A0ABY2DH43_9ACTN|nr:tetratricopeptide repeat protein [Micromonospora fluostatini]
MTVSQPPESARPGGNSATHTGPATASHGAFANSGTIQGGFHQHLPPAPPPSWPLRVGTVPPLASAFQPRTGLRDRIEAARHLGADVVLTQQHTAHLLAGIGGVGKSQLAAAIAHDALADRTTDLVLWVDAGTPDQLVTSYATAAVRVQAPGAVGADPATAARCFLDWLHTTDRSWLIVLDDVTDPARLSGWWPPRHRKGWTLATTRLRDVTLTSAGRRAIPVDTYTPPEATAYLTQRLTEAGYAHRLDPTGELADALGYLPLALSHAAAYLVQQNETCTTYLDRYRDGERRLADLMPADIDPDEYGRPVAVTLLLALDAADAAAPPGLARPALALAALLDPAGHPDSIWTSSAVTRYLAGSRPDGSADQDVTAEHARRAMRLLHRFGLVEETSPGPRAVRIHALTARAVRDTLDDLTTVAHAAADALMEIWPAIDHAVHGLPEALRANTAVLSSHTGDALWHPEAHMVLYQAGRSLLNAGLHATAAAYWRTTADTAIRILGHRHPHTLTARANLANAYRQAGRIHEAVDLLDQVLADRVDILGERHPDTLMVRVNLAGAYREAGRTRDAIDLFERVRTDSGHVLGDRHPDTLMARANLANAYREAGRTYEAIRLYERVLTDSSHILGDRHPNTLTARANLALCHAQAGRIHEAIDLIERSILTDCVEILGDRHPDTLSARGNLAHCYWRAGRVREAIDLEEQVLADRVDILGERHPDTLMARANLAGSYQQAGRSREAIDLYRRALTDSVDILGEFHPHTLTIRADLAFCYRQAGRIREAVDTVHQVLTGGTDNLGG